MLNCIEVSIAPAAVIAAPEPVFDTDRVDSGPPLVKESGALIFDEVTAPSDGIVRAVPVEAGQQVDAGTVLVVLEEESA